MITKAGRLQDGSLLGEQDGAIFVGTQRVIPFSAITRDVRDNGDGTYLVVYLYGDQIIGKGMVYSEPGPEPETSDHDVTVVDWAPL